jgi:heme/copper-type cytochrome/quinol oxidase subunit 3
MSTLATGERPYPVRSLPVGAIGASASGWWGVWFLMISESFLFAYLLFSYFYFSVQPDANWVPGGPPSFLWPGLQTAAVLLGCAGVWFARRSMRLHSRGGALIGLGAALVLCSAFIVFQFVDWFDKPFPFALDTYSSEYYLITGAHLAHVVLGWVMLLMVVLWTAFGYFDSVRYVPISVMAVYWYFVTAIWIGVFFTLTCTPYFF